MNNVIETPTPDQAIINPVGEDILKSLRQTGTLATFSLRKWSGEISDKDAADDVKANAGATGDVAKVIKNVMAGSDKELKAVLKIQQAARTDFYALTVPWYSGKHDAAGRKRGARFLPNRLFMEYTQTMGRHRGEFKPALDKFLAVYPQRIQEAIANLGTLANAMDYPDVEFIRSRFAMSMTWSPVPSGNDFAGLPEETLNSLSKNFDTRTAEQVGNATLDAVMRTKELVERMAERLHDDQQALNDGKPKRFHNSLVKNLEDMVRMLPAFNIANDPKVSAIIADLDALVQYDAQSLRDNKQDRDHVQHEAQKLADKMGRMGI